MRQIISFLFIVGIYTSGFSQHGFLFERKSLDELRVYETSINSEFLGFIKTQVAADYFPTAIGNHDDDIDDGEKGIALFNKYCGDTEFSFIDRNSYFIVLDNKIGDLSDSQFKWLEGQFVKGQEYDNIFVLMHKPPFNPYQQSWYRAEQNDWSYKFMKMCEQYKVDMVFSGHEYISRVVDFGGVKYVVTGGAGAILFEAPAWDNAYNHYVVVKVNGDYVDYEIRRVFPPVWQYTFLYFWKDLYYIAKQLLN
jgi:3',5'-cyclic AMP phosphodiesterase CpdA